MQFFLYFYERKTFCGVEAIGGPAEQSTAGGACDDEEDDRIGKPGMSGFVELWWDPESFFEASAYEEA